MAKTPDLSRRMVLSGGLVGAGMVGAGPVLPASARSQTLLADLRGSFDTARLSVRPGALDNQSAAFQDAINQAVRDGHPLFLPAGDYLVSNLDLPSGITLVGVPGQTRIRYAGDGHLLFAANVRDIRLEGLVLDGDNRSLADYAPALLHVSSGRNIVVQDCIVQGSTKTGVRFDQVAGQFARSTVSGVRGTAFQSNNAQGLVVRDNVIEACSGNGIAVSRWSQAHDGTLVTGNRIARIQSPSSADGPNGNGIYVFRADDVMVSGNTLQDCDVSAVRSDETSGTHVTSNQSHRSGDAAILTELGSDGALIANNIVDTAASGICVSHTGDTGRLTVIQGNSMRNLGGADTAQDDPQPHGIGISAEADTSITGNVIEDATVAGVRIGWGPDLRNVIVSQNLVRRAPTGVMVSVVDGVGASIISDNLFDQTPNGAVVGTHWGDIVTDDLTTQRRVPAPLIVEGNRRAA